MLHQAASHDAFERGWGHALHAGERRRFGSEYSGDHAGPAVAFECPPPGDHLVENRAEREDVAARVRLPPLQLFGSHVLQSADHGPFRRQRLLQRDGRGLGGCGPDLRQTEVEQLHSGGSEHHVAWLEVAVKDAGAVRAVEGVGDLNPDLRRLSHRQRPAAQAVGERLPFQELHHQIVLADVE